MPKVINLKKKKIIGRKEIIVIVFAIVLTTIGIKAADNMFGPGSEAEDNNGKCPADMVFVAFKGNDFCLDKYEASPSGDCPYSNPENTRETRFNLDNKDCRAVSSPDAIPWKNITQDQAALACAKAGKRLPTSEEWLQGALGTPDLSGNWTGDDCQVAGNWEAQPGLSGSGKNCVSSAGAYDMIGNVWEWVQGAVVDGVYEGAALPAAGFIDSLDGKSLPGATNPGAPNPDYYEDYFWIKEKGLRGIVRGGYWNNKADAGQYSVYAVTPPSSAEVGIGFRCVK